MDSVNKSLPINLLELTNTKQESLSECYKTYFQMVSEFLKILKDNKGITRKELHEKTYHSFREKYDAPSQLVISARVNAWNKRKQGFPQKVCVRFDKRLYSFKETEKGNPILSVRVLEKRLGLPIQQDGAWDRIQEHLKEGWEVTSVIMKSNLDFRIILSKEFEPKVLPNLMGIDINSSRLAVSIINPRTGKTLKQTYFGEDIYRRQCKFEQRRAKLMKHRDNGSSKAGKKLKELSGKQRNFVKTRIWQIVSELVTMAKKYYATPVIENIKNLKESANRMRKSSRKKTNKIPYGFFKFTLENKMTEAGIKVIKIEPEYTSQRCPECGHTSKGNWVSKNYSLFRCQKCGLEANRDRIASKNIAIKATSVLERLLTDAIQRRSQFSKTEASVNRLVRPNDTSFVMPSHG